MVRRVPNLAKIRRLIGYQPSHSLPGTLRDVIAHVRREIDAEEQAGVGR